MTNPLGTGTCNLSVNVPTDERQVIGQLAFRLGFKSVGDFMRHLVLSGLEREDTQSAQTVREIRRRYYGAAMLVLFLSAIVLGHSDFRRCRTRTRIEHREEETI